ncbi:hypothetical protein D9M70_334170 [compost metagenome]
MPQVVVDAHAVRGREVRQEVLAEPHLDVAALGDLDGVFQRLGQVGKQLPHFLGGLQVLLVGVVARPARVVEGASLADAHAGFVGLEVVLLDEAHVVGRHQRRATARGQRHRGMQVLLVADPAGALHLQVEALGEDFHPFAEQGFGGGLVVAQQGTADLPFPGAGQRDQAVGGVLDPVALDDHQAVLLAIGPASGDQFGEVAVALGVHHQQGQARQRAIFLATGQPDVGAADRLDAGAHGGLVELHQRAHVALVGHRHRRHPGPGHRLDQRLDPHQAIDQGVFGVQTQVNERDGHDDPMQDAKTTRPGLYRALLETTAQRSSRSQIPGSRRDCTSGYWLASKVGSRPARRWAL